jgi:hypothetical protein
VRRLPGPAGDGLSDGGNSRGSHRFVSGLAENTNSIFCADSSESQTANGCPVLGRAGTTSREAQLRNGGYLIRPIARSPEREQKSCDFLLTMTYMDARHSGTVHNLQDLGAQITSSWLQYRDTLFGSFSIVCLISLEQGRSRTENRLSLLHLQLEHLY